MSEIKQGKRYEFDLKIPSDGKCKNGLLSEIYGDIGVIKTRDGQEWHVPLTNLRLIK